MKTKTEKNVKTEEQGKLQELRDELFNLRVQNLSGALENTSKIRQTRKEIARLLTTVNMAQSKGN